ncbi:hypothetical protein ACFSUK_02335 [Sphingobium scionense]
MAPLKAGIKFLARLPVKKLVETQRFQQMPPAAPINRRRHLRGEMVARARLDRAVRFPVVCFMVGFCEESARQAGIVVAVA